MTNLRIVWFIGIVVDVLCVVFQHIYPKVKKSILSYDRISLCLVGPTLPYPIHAPTPWPSRYTGSCKIQWETWLQSFVEISKRHILWGEIYVFIISFEPLLMLLVSLCCCIYFVCMIIKSKKIRENVLIMKTFGWNKFTTSVSNVKALLITGN